MDPSHAPGDAGDGTSQSPQPPPRTSKGACNNCHNRKVKCDASTVGFPCSNCVSGKRTDCRIHLKRKRAAKRSFAAPAQESSDAQVQAPSQPSASLIPFPGFSGAPELGSPVDFAYRAERRSSLLQHGREALSSSHGTAEYSVNEDDTTLEDAQGSVWRHLVEFIDQKDLSERVIDQAARVTYVGTDVSNINFLVRQRGVHDNSRFHYPTDRIDRRFTVYDPDRLPVEAFDLPDKDIVDELLHAYFTHVNPGFPVVDEDQFMELYQARDPSNPPSLLLLQSILLVGAHVARTGAEREALKASFFKKAKILFEARFERMRDVAVQAALLMTWHSDGQEDVAANAYYWIGIAARIAMGLGMHRDTTPSTQVLHTQRLWRRVFWLLFQCDVLISLQYGRPQAIHIEDCDAPMVSSSDFEGCGSNAQIDYVIQSTELCIIVSDILRNCFGPRVSLNQRKEAIERADQALAKWSLFLPDSLRLRPTLTLDLWPALLQLNYHNILILLHRPRPQKQLRPDLGPTDLDICRVAAGHIQAVFEGLRGREGIQYLWVSGINPLFTAMIQLSVELRFSNPILSIETLRKFDSTLYSLRELANCWPNARGVLHFFETSERFHRNEVRRTDTANTELFAGMETSVHVEDHDTRKNHDVQPYASTGAMPTPDNNDDAPPVIPGSEHGQSAPGYSNHGISEELSDWRQLFPFTGADVNDIPHQTGTFDASEEWQNLYWQEPGLEGFPPY